MAQKNGKINPEVVTGAASSDGGRPTIDINGTKCYLNIGNYPAAKLAMLLRLEVAEGSAKGEPYMTVTKNFGNYSGNMSFVQVNTTFVDENNMGSAASAVYEALNAQYYTRFGSKVGMDSGFSFYPLVQFDPEKLREFDSKGYESYLDTWSMECLVEQNKMENAMFGIFEDELENDFDNENDEFDDDSDDDIFGFKS